MAEICSIQHPPDGRLVSDGDDAAHGVAPCGQRGVGDRGSDSRLTLLVLGF